MAVVLFQVEVVRSDCVWRRKIREGAALLCSFLTETCDVEHWQHFWDQARNSWANHPLVLKLSNKSMQEVFINNIKMYFFLEEEVWLFHYKNM